MLSLTKYYSRINDGIVTHQVMTRGDWIQRNAWPNVPGYWVESRPEVNVDWRYDSESGQFHPPAK